MINSEIQSKIVNYLTPYQPKEIGIFGSYARGENNSDSDLDLYIDLGKRISPFDSVQIERELSELVGIKVDILTKGALRNEKLKSYIHNDLKTIF